VSKATSAVGGYVQSLLNACLGEGGEGSGSGPSEVRFHASSMLPGQQSTHVRVFKSLQSAGWSDVMCNVGMYNPSRSDMHSLLASSTLVGIVRAMGYHASAPIANMKAYWSLHPDDSIVKLRVCHA
jgi:hypothetical protein